MAVVIQCYHCETILELDEGFRGGVCRCSTCGSLLQVPKAASPGTPKARPAAPGAVVSDGGRPANPLADPGLSRGQFDPKNQSGGRPAVPDFGGSSSGLRQGRPAGPAVAAKAPRIEKVSPISGPTRPGPHLRRVKKSNTLLYLGVALLSVVVITAIVVIIIVVNQASTPEPKPKKNGDIAVAPGDTGAGGTGGAGGADQGPGTTPPPAAGSPLQQGFLGIPLAGKKIVVSIDVASSMGDYLDYVQYGVYRAIPKLEAGQTLEVVLWKGNNVQPLKTGFVGSSGLKAVRDQLDPVAAMGASDAAACMTASMKLGADQVIFVTAKDTLEMAIADKVFAEAAGARIDGVRIVSQDDPSPLDFLAKKTGGKFEFVTDAQLKDSVH